VGRHQRLRTLETEAMQRPHPTAERKHGPLVPVQPVALHRRLKPAVEAGQEGQKQRDDGYLFRVVPAERRSSQASTTRLAMPASASFPQARGSYAFLLPTSPSTFNTPS
jgi:hypothetical protein